MRVRKTNLNNYYREYLEGIFEDFGKVYFPKLRMTDLSKIAQYYLSVLYKLEERTLANFDRIYNDSLTLDEEEKRELYNEYQVLYRERMIEICSDLNKDIKSLKVRK